tara:strand:+ start:6755 stop:6907 length:153 start_codon:yes stop_codon:yes gene_type:complete
MHRNIQLKVTKLIALITISRMRWLDEKGENVYRLIVDSLIVAENVCLFFM